MKAFAINIADFDITLHQNGSDSFRVSYGAQVSRGLSYADAARELGESIMHALACEGRIEGRKNV